MRKVRMRAGLVLTAVVLLIGALPVRAGASTTSPASLVAEVVDQLNNERQARGLSRLPVADLGAQHWTNVMAVQNNLYHDTSQNHSAENVLYAPTSYTSGDATRLWMDSVGHRTNVLNPHATAIDVGITCSGNRMWATSRFQSAWQIPQVAAGVKATPAGAGTSCTGVLNVAAMSAATVTLGQGQPGTVGGAATWFVSTTKEVRFDAKIVNPNTVPVYVVVDLPCKSGGTWVSGGATLYETCSKTVPTNSFGSYRSQVQTFSGPGGAALGVRDQWWWSMGTGSTAVQPIVAVTAYPSANPYGGVTAPSWMLSPGGRTVWSTWISNPNSVPLALHVVLPCFDTWVWVGAGVTTHFSCETSAPVGWTPYASHVASYVPGEFIGVKSGWIFNLAV